VRLLRWCKGVPVYFFLFLSPVCLVFLLLFRAVGRRPRTTLLEHVLLTWPCGRTLGERDCGSWCWSACLDVLRCPGRHDTMHRADQRSSARSPPALVPTAHPRKQRTAPAPRPAIGGHQSRAQRPCRCRPFARPPGSGPAGRPARPSPVSPSRTVWPSSDAERHRGIVPTRLPERGGAGAERALGAAANRRRGTRVATHVLRRRQWWRPPRRRARHPARVAISVVGGGGGGRDQKRRPRVRCRRWHASATATATAGPPPRQPPRHQCPLVATGGGALVAPSPTPPARTRCPRDR